MRKQFVETVDDLLRRDERLILLLGDIGVYGFSRLAHDVPSRVLNFGILEQSMMGAAAGLSSEGCIPIVHSIAPFIVERAHEQIKIDFAYQGLLGNLVSVGASYDYAALGPTHHCPADVSLLSNIPGLRIFLPGCAHEFDLAFRQYYSTGLNYFRLSEEGHKFSSMGIGQTNIRNQTTAKTVIIFVGPTLRLYDPLRIPHEIEVIYLNFISDCMNIVLHESIERCLVVQDFYSGPLESILCKLNRKMTIRVLAPQRRFYSDYGSRDDAFTMLGLTENKLYEMLSDF